MWGIHKDPYKRSGPLWSNHTFYDQKDGRSWLPGGAKDRAIRMKAVAEVIKSGRYDFIMFQVK